MKKLLVLALALIMALGCVSAFAEGETENVKFGVSVADLANVFYVDITDGMNSVLKDGDELIIMDAAFDAAKQLSLIHI